MFVKLATYSEKPRWSQLKRGVSEPHNKVDDIAYSYNSIMHSYSEGILPTLPNNNELCPENLSLYHSKRHLSSVYTFNQILLSKTPYLSSRMFPLKTKSKTRYSIPPPTFNFLYGLGLRGIDSPAHRNHAVLTILSHAYVLPYRLLVTRCLDEISYRAVFAKRIGNVLACVRMGIPVAHSDKRKRGERWSFGGELVKAGLADADFEMAEV